MRVLVKVGGAQLDEPGPRARFARAAAAARAAGHELVVVHGGGRQTTRACARLGLAEVRHAGLRVTDAATAEVVLWTLGGSVNRELVRALGDAGVRAVGLTGADGGLFTAEPLAAAGVDLGFVGRVARVDRTLVECLLAGGYAPVVATVAPARADEPFYNVNADSAAGPLAAALDCDALLLLTDVSGVLGADGARLAEVDATSVASLVADGVVTGGMLPKLEAALGAAAAAPGCAVTIAPADGDDAVLAALAGDTGTRLAARGG